jgi:hypothetical protein
MKIKTFTAGPRSDNARAFANEVQDYFADNNLIVDIKYIFTPIQYQYHLYVWNQYMDVGIYWQNNDVDEFGFNLLAFDEMVESKKLNIEQCNYYQWTKCMHIRTDWQEKYPQWMEKYRLYKLEKCFEK